MINPGVIILLENKKAFALFLHMLFFYNLLIQLVFMPNETPMSN
jgi:hypothetical protein